MSGIQQRIAEIQVEHMYEWDGHRKSWCCGCEILIANGEEWASHVAEVLVSELGLVERIGTIGGIPVVVTEWVPE
jgi:hypothetical protein